MKSHSIVHFYVHLKYTPALTLPNSAQGNCSVIHLPISKRCILEAGLSCFVNLHIEKPLPTQHHYFSV